MTTQKPILILLHDRACAADYLSSYCARRNFATVSIVLRDSNDLPDAVVRNQFGGVVVLDAGCNVLDPPAWLARERDWLAALIEAGMPVLAHGSGAHLVTLAAGGDIEPCAPTRGWFPVRATLSARALGLHTHLPPRLLLERQAASVPPPAARALVSGIAHDTLAYVDGALTVLEFHPHMASAAYAERLRLWRGSELRPNATCQTAAELEHAAGTDRNAGERFAQALYDAWLAHAAG